MTWDGTRARNPIPGTTLCTPVAANTMVQVSVAFGVTLPHVPVVVCTPTTTANAECFAYPSNVTETGFIINFRRSSIVATNVNWIAF